MSPKPRLLRALFWIISILMVAFVVGGFLLPRRLQVTRATTIQAPAMEVYDQLQSFRNWETWAPWFKRDPFLEKEFKDPPAGVGAMMSWNSKSQGQGRIKIVSSFPGQSLRMAVDFGSNGEAEMSLDLTSSGGATTVEWSFQSDFGQNMAKRYFGLFFAGSVESDLDEALANLKAKMENPPAKPAPPP